MHGEVTPTIRALRLSPVIGYRFPRRPTLRRHALVKHVAKRQGYIEAAFPDIALLGKGSGAGNSAGERRNEWL